MNAVDQVNGDDVDTGLKQSLLKLCVDAEFKHFETDLNVFNPFRVHKVDRYDLRHTATLA